MQSQCLHRKEAEGDLTQKEKKIRQPQKQRLGGCCHKPKNASRHQELEEARNRFSLRTSGGGRALPAP